jgi:tetratricopeptide (TPR) repeat protein
VSLSIEQLELKLSRRPQSPLLVRLASEYLSLNRITEAKELCAAGIEKYPFYSTAYLLLARCHDSENDLNSALELIRQARALNPNSSVLIDFQSRIENLISSSLSESSHISISIPTDTIVADESQQETDTIQQSDSDISSDLPTFNIEETIPSISEQPLLFPVEINFTDKVATSDEQEILSDQIESNEPIEQSVDPRIEESEATNDILEDAEMSIDVEEQISYTESIESASEKIDHLELQVSNGDEFKIQTEAEPVQLEQSLADELPQIPIPDIEELQQPDQQKVPVIEAKIVNLPSQQQNLISDPNVIEVSPENDLNRLDKESDPDATKVIQDFNNAGRIVSKTLAEIYAIQGEYSEAIITYLLLKQFHPERSDEIDARISELENKIRL